MNLGERIIALRKQRGISQQALAEALDVSLQLVSKWETNASVPDLDKLVKLADYFHITLDELITGQSVGLFFLCLSAAMGFLSVMLLG